MFGLMAGTTSILVDSLSFTREIVGGTKNQPRERFAAGALPRPDVLRLNPALPTPESSGSWVRAEYYMGTSKFNKQSP